MAETFISAFKLVAAHHNGFSKVSVYQDRTFSSFRHGSRQMCCNRGFGFIRRATRQTDNFNFISAKLYIGSKNLKGLIQLKMFLAAFYLNYWHYAFPFFVFFPL